MLEVRDPADVRSVVAEVPAMTAAEVAAAYDRARAAFGAWRRVNPLDRSAVLARAAGLVRAQAEDGAVIRRLPRVRIGLQGAGRARAAFLHPRQDGRGEVRVVAASPGGTTGAMTSTNAGHGTGGASEPVGIVGAGIVGLAVARQLAAAGVPVVVFEKEAQVATHQTGHNSGVVHAGIYYAPGSAKARMTRRGVGLLRAYCEERGLVYDERGKLVVARNDAETVKLRELERRSQANGVPGVQWLSGAELRELEPDVAGVAALLSPIDGHRGLPGHRQVLRRRRGLDAAARC